MPPPRQFTFLEFFAGGGMARLGLGGGWRCLFANDFDPMKRDAYAANFGLEHFHGGDISAVTLTDLPSEPADLAWASSPCQDLSLAGARAGLGARRSGAFFGFWRIVETLCAAARSPRLIVIENVAGLLTSNDGADFVAVVSLMASRGYVIGALVLNAAAFVPQSRPRLFIVARRRADGDDWPRVRPADDGAPQALLDAVAKLGRSAKASWRWIDARPQAERVVSLADILEEGAPFDPHRVTMARLAAMAPRQRDQVNRLAASGDRHVGAAFRRIRVEAGVKHARVEARFDGIAGCVRTPAGGSSRQIIFEIDGGRIRSRLMTPREAARAMGLGEDYRLPNRATAALKLVGDGVSPPVVAFLARTVLEPALHARRAAA